MASPAGIALPDRLTGRGDYQAGNEAADSAGRLVILLIAAGSLSFESVRESAMQYLPTITSQAKEWLNIVPYTSTAFLVGLALGLWKG